MLLVTNKWLRQLAGLLETGNLLLLKLAFKNPSAVRLYPGKVYRDYMSLAGTGAWRSKGFFEIFPQAHEVRIVLEHSCGEGIYTPVDELAYLALITRVPATAPHI